MNSDNDFFATPAQQKQILLTFQKSLADEGITQDMQILTGLELHFIIFKYLITLNIYLKYSSFFIFQSGRTCKKVLRTSDFVLVFS